MVKRHLLPGSKCCENGMEKKAVKIVIQGLVQGVGFRPFIYRLAHYFGLKGYVRNTAQGVEIVVEGSESTLERFVMKISSEAPKVVVIQSIMENSIAVANYLSFEITTSAPEIAGVTQISPDLPVCEDCLNDLKIQPHRINYAFINCTNCGPRFSIIREVPYDRFSTTMNVFLMCENCKREYENPLDRRFHAQPIACNQCGPRYELIIDGKQIDNFEIIVEKVVNMLSKGQILGIKGVGGFHLIGDALQDEPARRIREIKGRENKPFAVMFKGIEELHNYADVNEEEENLLNSWKRPIVLLSGRKQLSSMVSDRFKTIGAIFPYMPIHYLLFARLKTAAIIFTSANLTEAPVIIDNKIAKRELGSKVDGLLVYDRDIYNRVDDSVAQVVNQKERVIRRARGYVPIPIEVGVNVEGILAMGAEQIGGFCLGTRESAILSQYIGDLKNFDAYCFYTESIDKFKRLYSFSPSLVVHDFHPDYLSTKYAVQLGFPTTAVQHHHAHIASCMAEHGISEKCIGICFDGTGYGADGNIWGSEILVADLLDFERVAHFEYIALPGGSAAIREPWRCAVSVLNQYFGNAVFDVEVPLFKLVKQSEINLVLQAIDKKINAPLSCGAGRFFDAVSALLGVCIHSTFEGEAAISLESIAECSCEEYYPIIETDVISFKSVFEGILEDLRRNVSAAFISAKFHNTIIAVVCAEVSKITVSNHINKVVLSGGVFQNKYILARLETKLRQMNYQVFAHERVPTNDGGVALGQLVVAASRRANKESKN